jgi:hypothetical protein
MSTVDANPREEAAFATEVAGKLRDARLGLMCAMNDRDEALEILSETDGHDYLVSVANALARVSLESLTPLAASACMIDLKDAQDVVSTLIGRAWGSSPELCARPRGRRSMRSVRSARGALRGPAYASPGEVAGVLSTYGRGKCDVRVRTLLGMGVGAALSHAWRAVRGLLGGRPRPPRAPVERRMAEKRSGLERRVSAASERRWAADRRWSIERRGSGDRRLGSDRRVGNSSR